MIREFNRARGEEDERIRQELLAANGNGNGSGNGSKSKTKSKDKTAGQRRDGSPRIQSPHNSAFSQEDTIGRKEMARIISRAKVREDEMDRMEALKDSRPFVSIADGNGNGNGNGNGRGRKSEEEEERGRKERGREAARKRREEDEFVRDQALRAEKMNR